MTEPRPVHVVTVTNQRLQPGANREWVTIGLDIIGPFATHEGGAEHALSLVSGLRRQRWTMIEETSLRWQGGVWFVEQLDDYGTRRTLVAVSRLTERKGTLRYIQGRIRDHFRDRPIKRRRTS